MNRSTGTPPNRFNFTAIKAIAFWSFFLMLTLLSTAPFRVTWLTYRDCWPAYELLILLLVPMCPFYITYAVAYIYMEPFLDRPNYDFSLCEYVEHIMRFSVACCELSRWRSGYRLLLHKALVRALCSLLPMFDADARHGSWVSGNMVYPSALLYPHLERHQRLASSRVSLCARSRVPGDEWAEVCKLLMVEIGKMKGSRVGTTTLLVVSVAMSSLGSSTLGEQY